MEPTRRAWLAEAPRSARTVSIARPHAWTFRDRGGILSLGNVNRLNGFAELPSHRARHAQPDGRDGVGGPDAVRVKAHSLTGTDEEEIIAVGATPSSVRNMEAIVLRVRLISGDSVDVTYEDRDAGSQVEVIDHVVSTLSEAAGMLRCRHGDRLVVLYARGVAAVEVAPRGAVL